MTTNTPLPYPIPPREDGINHAGVAAHFAGLKKDPPAQLLPTWYAIVLRRMAGQNVDAECAGLLQLERDYNAGNTATQAEGDVVPTDTPAKRAFRTFKESQRGK